MTKKQTLEINFGEAEAFSLAIQHTVDGDKIAAQQAQSEADQQHAEQQQQQLV